VTRSPRGVTPEWFRSHVVPENHNTWDACEAALLADPYERRRVDDLKTELALRGFDEPVVLGFDHWWSRRPRVRDGVHRSIAAMELGIQIPIRYGYLDDADYEPL
jgi:hypothetical protein